MRFGASPQEVMHMAAQAAVAANTLFRQTGDPLDELVLSDDGLSTETLRNKMLRQQAYSTNKDQTTYLIGGAVVLGIVGLVYIFGGRR